MEEVTVHSWCKHTYSLFLLPLRLWHIKYVRWQRECVDVLQWTHWASIITPINLEPYLWWARLCAGFYCAPFFSCGAQVFNTASKYQENTVQYFSEHMRPFVNLLSARVNHLYSPFGSQSFKSQFWEGKSHLCIATL